MDYYGILRIKGEKGSLCKVIRNNQLCWAACTAMVGNYKKGLNKSAKNIADTMGIDYNDGGGSGDVRDALKKVYSLSVFLTYLDPQQEANMQSTMQNGKFTLQSPSTSYVLSRYITLN